MNIDIETISSNRSKLICTVTPEEAQAETDKVTRKYMAERAIPGFRKGKAPREAISKHFAAEIFQDALSSTVRSQYRKAVQDKNLKVYELIEIKEVKPTDDGGIVFEAEIDLEPEFDLPQYEGIPVDNADTIITDEKVEEELQSFRKSMSKFEDFTADSVATADDMINLSYSGTVDGKKLSDLVPDAQVFSDKDSSWCTVGSKYYLIPGITEALDGVKLGEEREVSIAFPGDFHKQELQGMTVLYKITVKEGRHLVVPEIDEAFLKSLHAESAQVLKDRIREHLESSAKQEDKERRIRQIIDFLVKTTPFELPKADFERNTEDALNRLIQYGMRRGASKENIEAEREKLMDTAKETADSRMRSSFVIGKIGEKLNVKLDDAEFNGYLHQVFAREHLTDAQIKDIVKDKSRIHMLYSEALKNKILENLLEKATPTASIKA